MLYIMRHGKTDWNELHKLQGRTDIPLNDEGRRMAGAVREECRSIGFDICYSSPLRRALETARIALEGLNVPIQTDERLMEMSFGIYEGTENSFAIPDCPINVLFRDPAHYNAVEGGESLAELYERTGSFLNEIVEPALREGKNVLIVGHGAMNCSIVSRIRQTPVEAFWEVGIPNCKLIRLL